MIGANGSTITSISGRVEESTLIERLEEGRAEYKAQVIGCCCACIHGF